MNLNTFGDYPKLTQEFVTYWGLLNAARVAAGQTDLVMNDGFTLADLIVAQGDLNAAIGAVTAKEEARSLAAPDRDATRLLAYNTFDSWRKRVASKLARTKYAEGVPILPKKSDGVEAFLKPFSAASDRWTSINAATNVPNFAPPLLLNDGTDLAGFKDLIGEVSAKTNVVSQLEDETTLLRRDRDALLPVLKMHFEDIRAAVIDEYPADSQWVQTLPKLSDRTPSTPDGVTIKVAFDAAAGGWKLSWKALSELGIARYSVRISAGARYKEDGAKSVGDLAPTATEFVVLEAEVPPGATVWAKVFVLNETNDERGSNAVKLAR